jgi:class 3 adenylate cyclase
MSTGTVTFLFTDIEGSTRLLQQTAEGYAAILADHHRILRKAAAEQGGREIDNQGDSFLFAFERANAGVGAAVLAQRALAEHPWPEGAEVRVRMGVHTREPIVGEERDIGLGVHRAARIGAVAHGGQILLSNATRELLEEGLAGIDSGPRVVPVARPRPQRAPISTRRRGAHERFLAAEGPASRGAPRGLAGRGDPRRGVSRLSNRGADR